MHAARNVIHGHDAIARFFLGLMKKAPPGPNVQYEIADINGWPALLFRENDQTTMVLAIETDGAVIRSVQVVLNPDKLKSV